MSYLFPCASIWRCHNLLGWGTNWQTSRREELLFRHPLKMTNQKSPGSSTQVSVYGLKQSFMTLVLWKNNFIWIIKQQSNHVIIFLAVSAPVSSAALDPKVASLAQQLEKLDEDLAKAEESMLSRLRAPLSRTNPAEDLANRLKEQQVTALKAVSFT